MRKGDDKKTGQKEEPREETTVKVVMDKGEGADKGFSLLPGDFAGSDRFSI